MEGCVPNFLIVWNFSNLVFSALARFLIDTDSSDLPRKVAETEEDMLDLFRSKSIWWYEAEKQHKRCCAEIKFDEYEVSDCASLSLLDRQCRR